MAETHRKEQEQVQEQVNDRLRKKIINIVEKIDDEAQLQRIYRFLKYIYIRIS